MDREALHDRIRRLLFTSPALSTAFTRGEFRSVFRGRGLDFDSLREYGPDDDARLIDWNVTVRQSRAYVRTYREDRSLELVFLLDRSASMDEGSADCSKADMALLVAALLGHAAGLRDMPVGGLHFSDRPLAWRAPRRGWRKALAFVELDLGAEGDRSLPAPRLASRASTGPSEASALADSIATVSSLLKRRSLVVILSDFRSAGWAPELALMARRHDVVALRLKDGLEGELPAGGAFQAVDPETGRTRLLALGSRSWRRAWAAFWEADAARIREGLAGARVPCLELDTADDPARRLLEFFEARRRRSL